MIDYWTAFLCGAGPLPRRHHHLLQAGFTSNHIFAGSFITFGQYRYKSGLMVTTITSS
jgi:hypothetical protein